VRELLLPTEPRPLPGRRWTKIVLRAAHVVCAAGFLGALVFRVTPDVRWPWALAVACSGGLLLLLDLHESGAFFVQVRGVVVLAKIALLAALPCLAGYEAWIAGVLMAVSVISSHAPSRVRYRVLVGRGRIKGSESMG